MLHKTDGHAGPINGETYLTQQIRIHRFFVRVNMIGGDFVRLAADGAVREVSAAGAAEAADLAAATVDA